jgi:predicted DNA-binding transcriptional regulator AlpA
MAQNTQQPFPIVGFLRLKQILGDKNAKPPITPIIPISKSGWWVGVKEGRYPPAIKISSRTTAWKAEDILALVESLGGRSTK